MNDTLRQFEAVRAQLLARDEARLARALARRPLDEARFARDAQRALLAAENRARLRPTHIDFPAELPVVQARAEIEAALREHPVIVLCGETGSGKTTQLPKICLGLGRGQRGLIGHTQPRRLAARSVARRIASELGGEVGGLVGFETRFDRRVGEHSLIKLMTDGILLAELQRDRDLLAYDTLIIDEAHERSLNIDFLLGWLKPLSVRRPDLRIIITSATLDPERLARHFGNCPILRVEGRTYPVELRYRAPEEGDLERAVADAVAELWTTPAVRGGDVLVFLPGEREIHELSRSLPGRFPQAEVLPLYSRLPAAQQDRVFSRGSAPRIVLATNVAETSVTVPGIRGVVDAGTARISRHSARLGVQQLQIEPVSQAAANQRAGRCGRVGPGVCIRLYEEQDFAARAPFTDPEILRSNLAGVILQMAALGLGDIEAYDWVDAPEARQINDGYRLLQTLGALDGERALTPLGRRLARLPLDPRIARIALAGHGTSVAQPVRALAAALSVQDPHDVPPDAREAARTRHAQWRHPRSDFISLLQLWERWQRWSAQHSNRALRKLCREHYLSYTRMEEWEAVHRQLGDLLDAAADTPPPTTPTDWNPLYAPIHKALLTGLIDHIGLKPPEQPDYQGPRGRRFRIFPGSALAKKSPQWIMSAQLAQTSALYARTNAAVEPEWLLEVGTHLVKRTMQNPTWNAERGEVTATEHASLFGLPLLKRARHYGSEAPKEARALFIRHALVNGEWPQKPAFLQHNLALVAAIEEKEARLRRPDLLADEAQRYRYYDTRLPEDICTCAGLRRWLARPGHAGTPGDELRMQESDVLRADADTDIEALFPDHLDLGDGQPLLRLSYTHDPGAEADGLSIHIPVARLFQLPAERFDWLVPGLRPALIEALLRSLPHNLRRHCTPAAEYARALNARMQPQEGALLPALCQHFSSMTGLRLSPQDFPAGKLPPHLRPRLLLEDAQGRVLGEADTLAALQNRHAPQARQALQQQATREDPGARWSRQGVEDWDFGSLPEQVALAGGACGWPALHAQDGRVDVHLFESAAAAQTAHRAGVRALLLMQMPDRLRDLQRGVRSRLGAAATLLAQPVEALAADIAQRSVDLLLDEPVRDAAAFQRLYERRGDFSRDGLQKLDDIAAWLGQVQALRQRLRGPGLPWAEVVSDIKAQLEQLLAPGFIREIPAAQWPRVALYLRAVSVRLERLPHKPQRDLELTAQLQPLLARLPGPWHPARWVIEEWRISQYAQELRAVGAPTLDKIRQALAG